MTRVQKIERLALAYKSASRTHGPTKVIFAKLRDCVTRQLVAEIKAHKRRVAQERVHV